MKSSISTNKISKISFAVYMLKCSDGTLYVGSTNNIEKRVHAHNHLKSGAKYTKGRRPVRLVYNEICKDFKEAKQKEYLMKCLTREEKLGLLVKRRKG